MKRKLLVLLAIVAVTCWAATASAVLSDVTFTGSSGSLSASAEFTVSGNTLTITLINTGAADCLVPADALTALFWKQPATWNLSPGTATLLSTNEIIYGAGTTITTNVGGEFEFLQGLSGVPGGGNAGISSAGFGVFGAPNLGGVDLNANSGGAIDGLDYGILSAGDNTATGNTGLTGNPMIKNEVIFTLTGASGIDLADLSGVAVQYGTSFTSEPSFGIPIPPSAVLMGSGLLGLGLMGWRRRRKE